MGISITCPNGHALKVKDELAGKTGLCPYCKAKVTIPQHEGLSDDDIMAVLGPAGGDEPKSAEQSPRGASLQETGIVTVGAALAQRKKTCQKCGGEISVAFRHCPRCGTPLPMGPQKPGKK
jgi:hypothetical protein